MRIDVARRHSISMALPDINRYWGTDVSYVTGSVSVASLHQLARERAAARHTAPPRVRGQGGRRESLTEGSVAVGDELMVCGREVEGRGKKADGDLTETYPMGITEGEGEGLPPLTHTAKSAVSVAVHRRLPAWITQPRLVNRDIESGSGPLSSVLLPAVITSNLKTMGYTSLFPIQINVIPEVLSVSGLPPRDVCVCAPTGCGKTLCYVVPMVTALLNCVVRQVRGIVVVPSRSLASQVATVFSQVAEHTRVQCGLVCGDASLEKEAARICDPSSFPPSSLVDIVIATPGRLAEHLMRGSFTSLQSMRFLVIDEADKLLSQQMCSWLPRLLQQVTVSSSGGLLAWLNSRSEVSHVLPSPLPPSSLPTPAHLPVATALACASSLLSTQQRVQKLLLSATMTQDPEALEVLQLHRPLLFSVAVPRAGREVMSLALPPSLSEAMVTCKASLKPLVLLHLLSQLLETAAGERRPQVLCFANSLESSERLQVVLRYFNWFRVAVVTSKVPVRERRRVLHQFISGEVEVLICSDALARGMDIPACSWVVNYDPPSLYHTYLHRVGRTARAGSEGHALSVLAKEQVSSFHRMLRVAHRPRMKEIQVNSDLLQPLQEQYEEALLQLKETVRR